jgi:hypothetical protein
MQWLGQKERKVGLVNAPPELALGSAQIPECSGQGNGEQVEVIRPAIGEDVVCLTPDTLIGIEFRRVCREALQVKAGPRQR